MARPITDEQRREWAAVHREAMALAKYFDRHGLNYSATIAEATEPSHPFRARLAGLREARNDLLEMTVDLPPSELRTLDAFLRENIAVSLDELGGRRLLRLATLRGKGRLSTNEQFRLVKGRHEQIWDQPAFAEEASALYRLMDEYESRKTKRSDSGPRGPGRTA